MCPTLFHISRLLIEDVHSSESDWSITWDVFHLVVLDAKDFAPIKRNDIGSDHFIDDKDVEAAILIRQAAVQALVAIGALGAVRVKFLVVPLYFKEVRTIVQVEQHVGMIPDVLVFRHEL